MKTFCEVKVPNGPVTTTYTVKRDSDGAVYISCCGSDWGHTMTIDRSAITSIVSGLLMARIQDYAVEAV